MHENVVKTIFSGGSYHSNKICINKEHINLKNILKSKPGMMQIESIHKQHRYLAEINFCLKSNVGFSSSNEQGTER